VNTRGLYRTRDGSPVEVNQVHARTGNYPDLFEKQGSQIRLKGEPLMTIAYPPTVTRFKDDDLGFLAWLGDHPAGYFINADRNPKPKYLILHRPGCPHIDHARGLHLTKDYIKVCADDRAALEEWAAGSVGGEPTLCPPASATQYKDRSHACIRGLQPTRELAAARERRQEVPTLRFKVIPGHAGALGLGRNLRYVARLHGPGAAEVRNQPPGHRRAESEGVPGPGQRVERSAPAVTPGSLGKAFAVQLAGENLLQGSAIVSEGSKVEAQAGDRLLFVQVVSADGVNEIDQRLSGGEPFVEVVKHALQRSCICGQRVRSVAYGPEFALHLVVDDGGRDVGQGRRGGGGFGAQMLISQ
jgi:hypothetical protein